MLAVHFHRPGPPRGGALGDRKAVLGVIDGRCQQLREWLRAERAPHRVPAGDDARHGHRVDAALRHLGDAFCGEVIDGETGRRPAARVQAVDGSALRLVIDDEKVAAQTVAGRLHQSDGGVGGDRRVDGVAAALENLHTGPRRQRLARGDNPKRGRHHRPAHDRPLGRLVLRLLCTTTYTRIRKQQCGNGDVTARHGDPPNGEILGVIGVALPIN